MKRLVEIPAPALGLDDVARCWAEIAESTGATDGWVRIRDVAWGLHVSPESLLTWLYRTGIHLAPVEVTGWTGLDGRMQFVPEGGSFLRAVGSVVLCAGLWWLLWTLAAAVG